MTLFKGIISLMLVAATILADDSPKYKMCVPHGIFDACEELVAKQPSNYATITCVSACDRMECLEKVKNREADFVGVDPEDMYVAFNMRNEDFSVFSEIRTVEEPEAEFRYEGIMLVHKNSSIKSLNDLSGKKSCHTGYGRNVGYKIPITKLRKHGIFKLSANQYLPSLERELKGLSELFSESCLVGTYSPNEEINQLYKKRYSNLCALCEDPVKCNYPDKYSGYEGAIRCLVEKGGDVAFTKVIYVRRFFGLPINDRVTPLPPQANPNDYEYLCEDGSRRAVIEKPCSWAQRPWQGYMSNSDVKTRLSRLQNRIEEYYEEGKKSSNKEAAAKLWINDKNVVVKKEKQALPGDHLIQAHYKDVIEREGPTEQKIRLCVKDDVELRKCQVMRNAAYSRDIRPEILCVLSTDCIANVQRSESDAVIINRSYQKARESQLIPVAHEISDAHYFVVVKKDLSDDKLANVPIQYDPLDENSRNAALNFNWKRGNGKCTGITTMETSVRIVRSSQAGEEINHDTFDFICRGKRQAKVFDVNSCAYDSTPPAAVYVRNAMTEHELDGVKHTLSALSDLFGRYGYLVDVFELFGEFEPGHENVLFSDNAMALITDDSINSAQSFFSSDDDELDKNNQCQNS